MNNAFTAILATTILSVSSLAGHAALAASCVSAFGMASSSETDAFKSDPQTLMAANPQGGGVMSRSTRELVLAETDFNGTILSLAASANTDQRSAFGVGLGQATLACSHTNPEVAQQISMAVLSRGSADLLDAYKSVIGDVDTFAVSQAPAPSSSPLGGTDANVRGGGEEAEAAGVKQNGPASSSLSSVSPISRTSSSTPVVTALGFSNPQAGSGSGSGSGSQPSSPPSGVTVPGPVLGEGPMALLVVLSFGYFAYRSRRNAA